jgi:hypothetical protein
LIRNATRVADEATSFCFFVFSTIPWIGVAVVGESPDRPVSVAAVRLRVLFAEPVAVAASLVSSSSELASDRGVSSAGHSVVQGAAWWSVSDSAAGAASTALMSMSALLLLLLLLLLLRVPSTPE